jgi:hypothetical protein
MCNQSFKLVDAKEIKQSKILGCETIFEESIIDEQDRLLKITTKQEYRRARSKVVNLKSS